VCYVDLVVIEEDEPRLQPSPEPIEEPAPASEPGEQPAPDPAPGEQLTPAEPLADDVGQHDQPIPAKRKKGDVKKSLDTLVKRHKRRLDKIAREHGNPRGIEAEQARFLVKKVGFDCHINSVRAALKRRDL
jgi:hypothetical protein